MNNQKDYVSLDDPEFDVQITLRQAYMIMHQFLHAVYDIDDFPTQAMFPEIALGSDHTSFDRAILGDFLEAYQAVINDPSPIEKLYMQTDKAKTEAMGRKILAALSKVLGVEEDDDEDKGEEKKQG